MTYNIERFFGEGDLELSEYEKARLPELLRHLKDLKEFREFKGFGDGTAEFYFEMSCKEFRDFSFVKAYSVILEWIKP